MSRFTLRLLLISSILIGSSIPVLAESAAKLARKAEEYYQAAKMDEAIAGYRQALALDPDSAVLQYDLGTVLARKGNTDEAARVLHQAAREPTSPARPDALFNLGTALADHVSGELQNNNSSNSNGRVSAPQSQATKLQEGIETLEKAQQALREAILHDPRPKTSQEAKYNYEIVQAMLKDLKKRHDESEQQQKQDQKNQQQQNQQGQQQNQQNQNQANSQNQQQSQNGQGQNQGQSAPQPSEQHNKDANPQGSPTPQPGQNKSGEQQNKTDKQNEQNQAKQQHGLEGQPTPAPTAEPSPSSRELAKQSGKNEQNATGEAGALGSATTSQQTPTPGQLDAQRLLNYLEKEKPEQFKKLYQFQGRGEKPPVKDW